MEGLQKFHLSPDFYASNGTMQSSFAHAVNFSFCIAEEERLFTILCEGAVLLPDSVILSKSLFEGIKKSEETQIFFKNTSFSIGQTFVTMASEYAVDLFLPHYMIGRKDALIPERFSFIEKLITQQKKKSALHQMPKRYTDMLRDFVICLFKGEKQTVKAIYTMLAGAGKGLTPACDDAITGILSFVSMYMPSYQEYAELAYPILNDLQTVHRTTKVSEKYIKCACRGMFSLPLLYLLSWLAGCYDSFPMKEFQELVEIGHTSGMDTLYGIQIAFAVFMSMYQH